MKILVINGSPRGKNSITLQTVLYLQKVYPKHDFTILNVGQKIKQYKKDFTEIDQAIKKAELILFAYPVYTFLVPYQLQQLIEMMKENSVSTEGKFASQISTSKHFYDVTAHKYIEENCYDLGLKYIRGLSSDMDDLLTEKGRRDAESYFVQLLFNITNDIYAYKKRIDDCETPRTYTQSPKAIPKTGDKDIVIVTNCAEDDLNLRNMIEDFNSIIPHSTREVNLRSFPFSGGCLGCFSCAISAKCIYKDGFDDFLRNEIQTGDAIIYAFTIENHYTHSSFKCYDDRQFCNGHRAVTKGMPVGYLISGDYQKEANLQMVVEARSEVGGVYLCGVATDEDDTAKAIANLSKTLCYAFLQKPTRPSNFYGVGGTKIFRDLIYLMQGIMKADHKFYKKHGIYNFPQKQNTKILQMKLIGLLISLPFAKKKIKSKMNEYIIRPYKKVIECAVPEAKRSPL